LNKREALKRVGEVTESLRRQQGENTPFSESEAQLRLERALKEESLGTQEAQEIAAALSSGNIVQLQQALQSLSEALSNNSLSETERQALAKDLARLAEAVAAAGLGDMARNLSEAARSIAKGDLPAVSLDELMRWVEEMSQQEAEAALLGRIEEELAKSEARIANADQVCSCCGGRGGDCACGAVCTQCDGLGFCPTTSLGPGGPSAGGGSTNQAQPAGPEGQENWTGDTIDRNAGVQTAPYEEIYVPEKTAEDSAPTREKTHVGKGEGPLARSPLPVRTAPGDQPARVPYYKVVDTYRKVAAEAIEKEQIPPAYREQVKRYFESLR